MRTLDDVLAAVPGERRERIEAEAKKIIHRTNLPQFRRARKITQVQIAKSMGGKQHHVSRMERRSDMLVSTLDAYVRGVGGRLRLIAEMPGDEQVEISLSGEVDPRLKQSLAREVHRARISG
jgi:hypothetical protein